MESHGPHLLGPVPPLPKHSKELQTAVEDDVRRQEVDSAKKRAAAQNVDYESFAALVSMAHVKPFERRRGQQKESVKHIHALPAWSFDASGALAPSDSSQMSFNGLSGGETNKKTSNGSSLISKTENLITKTKGNKKFLEEAGLPAAATKCSVGCFEASCMTADAFKREWRRISTNLPDKLKFLLALPPGDLSRIFKAELPPSIFADVINVLCWWKRSSAPVKAENLVSSFPELHLEGTSTYDTGYSSACKSAPHETFDVLVAFQILSSLCVCGRFSLSLNLVGTRVQSAAMLLIEQLVQCLEMNEVCNERADTFSSMCSSDQHVDTKVECLKQLANLYSCT